MNEQKKKWPKSSSSSKEHIHHSSKEDHKSSKILVNEILEQINDEISKFVINLGDKNENLFLWSWIKNLLNDEIKDSFNAHEKKCVLGSFDWLVDEKQILKHFKSQLKKF